VALLALSLAACGGAGSSLERLTVGGKGIPLASLAWLPNLTALRELSLATPDKPMCLPAGLSRLHQLALSRLSASPLRLEAGCRLPASLTSLGLCDTVSEAMPHQVGVGCRGCCHNLLVHACRCAPSDSLVQVYCLVHSC